MNSEKNVKPAEDSELVKWADIETHRFDYEVISTTPELTRDECYWLGLQAGYAQAVKDAEAWCKADHESSFHPNLSSWRLFDWLKERCGE